MSRGRWYRAKVMEVLDDGATIDVFLVDTGETEYVPLSDVRPMRSHFLHTPFMAIECVLMHVEPLQTGACSPHICHVPAA